MYVAANAVSILKHQLDWRNAAARASEEERRRVAQAVVGIATAAQHWPTYHMHEDLAVLLSRLHELAVAYCPEPLAVSCCLSASSIFVCMASCMPVGQLSVPFTYDHYLRRAMLNARAHAACRSECQGPPGSNLLLFCCLSEFSLDHVNPGIQDFLCPKQ